MKLLVGVLVALVLVPAATAAPQGFRDSPPLTKRAKVMAGKPEAVVYCALNADAWKAKLVELLGAEFVGTYYAFGFTHPGESAIYLRQASCVPLERWLKGKRVDTRDLAFSAHTFAHETVHLSGVLDEKRAECDSLANLARTLRTHFGVKNISKLRDLVDAARWANRLSDRAC